MTKYETTLNLMRYEKHFMFVTNLDHIRHSFKCRNCGKYCKNMKAVKAHEPNRKITSYILNGGFYDAQENIFTTIFKTYKKSLKILTEQTIKLII